MNNQARDELLTRLEATASVIRQDGRNPVADASTLRSLGIAAIEIAEHLNIPAADANQSPPLVQDGPPSSTFFLRHANAHIRQGIPTAANLADHEEFNRKWRQDILRGICGALRLALLVGR
jgi:hypothetical protein